MDLIVHIGHAKTGTTSIQTCLTNNSNNLLKKNIVYFPTRGVANNDMVCIVNGKIRTKAGESHTSIKEKSIKNIKKIIELSLENNSNYIILSSESFFGLSTEQLNRLLKQFNIKLSLLQKSAINEEACECSGVFYSHKEQSR
jgi:hypothetical protein